MVNKLKRFLNSRSANCKKGLPRGSKLAMRQKSEALRKEAEVTISFERMRITEEASPESWTIHVIAGEGLKSSLTTACEACRRLTTIIEYKHKYGLGDSYEDKNHLGNFRPVYQEKRKPNRR